MPLRRWQGLIFCSMVECDTMVTRWIHVGLIVVAFGGGGQIDQVAYFAHPHPQIATILSPTAGCRR